MFPATTNQDSKSNFEQKFTKMDIRGIDFTKGQCVTIEPCIMIVPRKDCLFFEPKTMSFLFSLEIFVILSVSTVGKNVL